MFYNEQKKPTCTPSLGTLKNSVTYMCFCHQWWGNILQIQAHENKIICVWSKTELCSYLILNFTSKPNLSKLLKSFANKDGKNLTFMEMFCTYIFFYTLHSFYSR
jgi:hypothetical protein